MFDVIDPRGERIARFNTLEQAGRFLSCVHVACRIVATPARIHSLEQARAELGLPATTFRRRQDERHPHGFRPMGPARYDRRVA